MSRRARMRPDKREMWQPGPEDSDSEGGETDADADSLQAVDPHRTESEDNDD
jgi:hypothetical protein